MSGTENPDKRSERLAAIRLKAMDLLARREHSVLELQRKLGIKFPDDTALVENVISALQENNLQSDERFAEAFVSSRFSKGQGPCRISMELRQRGVGERLINQVLENDEFEWGQLARNVLRKKYGESPCVDYKERSRRSHFLHYRGFTMEQISACFDR